MPAGLWRTRLFAGKRLPRNLCLRCRRVYLRRRKHRDAPASRQVSASALAHDLAFRALMKLAEQVRAGNAQLAEISEYLSRQSAARSSFSQIDQVAPADLVQDFEHVARTQVRKRRHSHIPRSSMRTTCCNAIKAKCPPKKRGTGRRSNFVELQGWVKGTPECLFKRYHGVVRFKMALEHP